MKNESMPKTPNVKEIKQSDELLLTTAGIAFSSPDRLLFDGVNFSIRKGENIVLTGKSGNGKSVLLKILIGQVIPDTGSVTLKKDCSVSYVPQEIQDLQYLSVDPAASIKELFYQTRGLNQLERRKAELENKLASGEGKNGGVLEEYQDIIDQYEAKDGYIAELQIEEILRGLSMEDLSLDTSIAKVSSGQTTKLLLGQALFSNSDLLILDDPSSHLDSNSVEWLAQYLKKSDQSTIVATNNLAFINTFANKVIEITEIGRVISFKGNYEEFTMKRDRMIAAELKAFGNRNRRLDKLQETIKYFTGMGANKNSARIAQTVNALESRVEREKKEINQMPGAHSVKEPRIPKIKFEERRRSGDHVVSAKGLRKAYGTHMALDLHHLELTVKRGEFVIVSGENGSGKSTLLRMLAMSNFFPPTEGNIEFGTNIDMVYYAPDNEDISSMSERVLEEARRAKEHSEEQVGPSLIFWGFTGEDIEKKTLKQLSKGERAQLAMAKIMLAKPNLMILDEPTNNLNSKIVERFIDAIQEYTGTLILASHDPRLLKNLRINKVLHLPEGQIQVA